MSILALGLEFDHLFPEDRSLILLAHNCVRAFRSGQAEDKHSISEMACGLGLRVRFGWEREGKRTGVLRTIGYQPGL
jgi:hypothetical protein